MELHPRNCVPSQFRQPLRFGIAHRLLHSSHVSKVRSAKRRMHEHGVSHVDQRLVAAVAAAGSDGIIHRQRTSSCGLETRRRSTQVWSSLSCGSSYSDVRLSKYATIPHCRYWSNMRIDRHASSKLFECNRCPAFVSATPDLTGRSSSLPLHPLQSFSPCRRRQSLQSSTSQVIHRSKRTVLELLNYSSCYLARRHI